MVACSSGACSLLGYMVAAVVAAAEGPTSVSGLNHNQTLVRMDMDIQGRDAVVLITVDHTLAPLGAERFIQLVQLGFYNDSAIFRFEPGFVLQFGVSGDVQLNEQWHSETLPDEPVVGTNTRGMLAFASAGADTRSTEIFVNMANNSYLDAQGFSVFGYVESGLAELEQVHAESDVNQNDYASNGNEWLRAHFPELTFITGMSVVDNDEHAGPATSDAASMPLTVPRPLSTESTILTESIQAVPQSETRTTETPYSTVSTRFESASTTVAVNTAEDSTSHSSDPQSTSPVRSTLRGTSTATSATSESRSQSTAEDDSTVIMTTTTSTLGLGARGRAKKTEAGNALQSVAIFIGVMLATMCLLSLRRSVQSSSGKFPEYSVVQLNEVAADDADNDCTNNENFASENEEGDGTPRGWRKDKRRRRSRKHRQSLNLRSSGSSRSDNERIMNSAHGEEESEL